MSLLAMPACDEGSAPSQGAAGAGGLAGAGSGQGGSAGASRGDRGGRATGGVAGASGGQAGGGGFGGLVIVGGAGGQPVVDPECARDGTLGGPTVLLEPAELPAAGAAGAGSVDASLEAVTPSGNTLALRRGDAVVIADRDDDGAGAYTLQTIVPAGADLTRGLGLSADGLRLVVVVAGGQGLAELRRADRGADWSTSPDEAAFDTLNLFVAQTLDTLAAPVFGADDLRLYFAFDRSPASSTVWESVRATTNDGWTLGEPLDESPALVRSGAPPWPLGVSSDGLALFFREPEGGVGVVWRESMATPFLDMTSRLLAADYTWAAPVAACEALILDTESPDAGVVRASW